MVSSNELPVNKMYSMWTDPDCWHVCIISGNIEETSVKRGWILKSVCGSIDSYLVDCKSWEWRLFCLDRSLLSASLKHVKFVYSHLSAFLVSSLLMSLPLHVVSMLCLIFPLFLCRLLSDIPYFHSLTSSILLFSLTSSPLSHHSSSVSSSFLILFFPLFTAVILTSHL